MRYVSITLMFLFIAILTFTLGMWQLYRLDWKNNLIENINTSIENPEYFEENKNYGELTSVLLEIEEFQKFSVIDKPIFIESKTYQNKVGYHAVVPIVNGNKIFSVLNIGWVSDKNFSIVDLVKKLNNLEEFQVYIRDFNSEKPLFIPENDINKNIWFSINKKDLELFFQQKFNSDILQSIMKSKYYFVLLEPQIKLDIDPSANLRNNHLNYSITWFLLSLSSIIMLLIIRKKNG